MSLLQIDFQIPLYKYIYVCMHEYMCTVYIYSDPSCPHPSCLQSSYPHPRCVPSLENAIKEVDAAYDFMTPAMKHGLRVKQTNLGQLSFLLSLLCWVGGAVDASTKSIKQTKENLF